MRRRSPARWLAPLAIVACAVAVYSVVSTGLRSEDPRSSATTSRSADGTSARDGSQSGKRRSRGKRRRTYTVKAGDTLSAIAEKTDVSLARLQELNPELDSQALQTGQRVKLSP